MPQKAEIIKDYQISNNTFCNYYNKNLVKNSLNNAFNIEEISNYNAQILYSYTLLEKALKAYFFSFKILSKSTLVQRNYEEIGELLMNNNENNNLHVPRISNDEFIESYIKLTKKIMQRIANKQLIYLQKYAVHHKVYGELNLLELIFLTIQLNYIAINKYKNLLCEDFYKVA